LLVGKDPAGAVTGTVLTSVEQHYRSVQETYSAELQHIADVRAWTFIAGGRAQVGQFEVDNRQQDLADAGPSLPEPLVQHVQSDLQRFSVYGYAQWQLADPLSLFGGLSYDYLLFPANHRFAPVLSDEDSRDQWSPKVGLLWKASPSTTLRGAYTRSLGGVSLEQSFQLEPSQIAGINQAWRSLIPESAVGSQAGARLETGAVEWDQRFPTETYLAVRGETGRSVVHRQVGVLDQTFFAEASSTPEHLDFRETTLSITLNQLVGQSGVLGAQYRLSNAQLEDVYPAIPENVPHSFPPYELHPRQDLESTLHQVRLFAGVNYASGLFGQIESLWSAQSNHGYSPARPGDDFWQFNLYAGYRFPGRRVELRLGLLNLTDQDYRLNPLNLTPELPRSRTFVASLRLVF
jgi:outer membrane receptor protein involved in Fe transport